MIGSNVGVTGMVEALAALDAPAPVYDDNYLSEMRRLARFLLDHAPEGMRKSDRGDLERVRLGESEHVRGIEFRRESPEGEASADLYVDFDNWGASERFDDAAGNLWRRVTLRVRVSWSSWGSSEVEVASFRLALMSEVTEFAKRVKAEFSGDVFQIVATAAERAEQKEHSRKAEAQRKVRAIVESAPARKGMRLGEVRTVLGEFSEEVRGEWRVEVGVGGKKLSYVARIGLLGYAIERVVPVVP